MIRRRMKGRVLIVAGSDFGRRRGHSGRHQDGDELDGFATTAITALTAQNTEGVHSASCRSRRISSASRLKCVLDDIGADAIKTGMLHDAAVIETVAAVLASARRACRSSSTRSWSRKAARR